MLQDESFVLVNTQETLDYYVTEIEKHNILAIDTEFNRNNKEYLPQLCLIQVSYKSNFAIVVDCLANLNLTALLKCIYNEDTVKVLHASRQDIEMLFNITNKVPNNIFDTQIAVLAMNIKKDIAYDKLVHIYLGIELDKTLKNSHWHVRPLDENHIRYAALDAIYLYQCYILIKTQLNHHNRTEWLQDTFLKLQNPNLYAYNVQSNAKKLSQGLPLALYSKIFKILTWREEIGKELNLSRVMVLDNKKIRHLALQSPKNVHLESLVHQKAHMFLDKLHDAMVPVDNTTANIQPFVTLTEMQKNTLFLLKLLLNYCSNKYQISSELVADTQDLQEIVLTYDTKSQVFVSWRNEIFGKYVHDLLAGKLGIGILNDEIIIH